MKIILNTDNLDHLNLIFPILQKSIKESNFSLFFLKKYSNEKKLETSNKIIESKNIKGFKKLPLFDLFIMTDFIYKQEDFPAEHLQNKINVIISQKYVLPKGWDEHMLGGYMFFIYHLIEIKLLSKEQAFDIYKKVLLSIIKLNPCLVPYMSFLEKNYYDALFGIISRFNPDDIASYCDGMVYYKIANLFPLELMQIYSWYNLDKTDDVQFVLSEATIKKLILNIKFKHTA